MAIGVDVAPEVAALGALAAQHAEEGDRQRELAGPVVSALRRSGLFRSLVPAALGGDESSPQRFLDTVRALAVCEGAAAWVVAVTGVSGLLGAYLDPASAEEIYGGQSIVGGVFAPRGRAVADAAGLTVSGRWSFASGCAHADWLMVGCVVADGEDVLRTPGGSPEIRMVFFPRETYTVHDTWDVAGLRATGSHDIALEARTAVQAHSVSVLTQSPRIEAPLYAFPLFGLFAQSIAAVLLGIAEGALADLVELAVAKTPTGYARPLAARNDTQARVARAQAALDAVRSLVAETVGEAWSMAQAGDEVTLAARAALRRCATHAAETAVRVTGDMYALGGGTSVYRASPLQRRMRDIQVGAQHALVGPATLELAGRVSMGLQADVSQL